MKVSRERDKDRVMCDVEGKSEIDLSDVDELLMVRHGYISIEIIRLLNEQQEKLHFEVSGGW